MKIEKLKYSTEDYLDGPVILKPNIFSDERGFFYVSWNQNELNKLICKPLNFVQDMVSNSSHGVLRGMHYQLDKPQAKLVKVIKGKIFDVIVDLRSNSNSYMKWASVELSNENKKMIYVPKGFAHGFMVLSSFAEVLYKVDNYYDKNSSISLLWNDRDISINWPTNKIKVQHPITNQKDRNGFNFEEVKKLGYIF